MRFFTPELYARFNSSNDDEADQTNEDWESALLEYQKHLDDNKDHMPAQVKQLTELNLHDAELLACDQAVALQGLLETGSVESLPCQLAIAVVSVKQDGRFVSLIYTLSGRLHEDPAPKNWSFSKFRTHWLYDEVDVVPEQPGRFLHRVLLSDGRIIQIPFVSVFIQCFSLSPPAEGVKVRQSA